MKNILLAISKLSDEEKQNFFLKLLSGKITLEKLRDKKMNLQQLIKDADLVREIDISGLKEILEKKDAQPEMPNEWPGYIEPAPKPPEIDEDTLFIGMLIARTYAEEIHSNPDVLSDKTRIENLLRDEKIQDLYAKVPLHDRARFTTALTYIAGKGIEEIVPLEKIIAFLRNNQSAVQDDELNDKGWQWCSFWKGKTPDGIERLRDVYRLLPSKALAPKTRVNKLKPNNNQEPVDEVAIRNAFKRIREILNGKSGSKCMRNKIVSDLYVNARAEISTIVDIGTTQKIESKPQNPDGNSQPYIRIY